jgi:hypothetical protein
MTFIAGFIAGIGTCLAILLLVIWLWWAAGDPEVQQ